MKNPTIHVQYERSIQNIYKIDIYLNKVTSGYNFPIPRTTTPYMKYYVTTPVIYHPELGGCKESRHI